MVSVSNGCAPGQSAAAGSRLQWSKSTMELAGTAGETADSSSSDIWGA